MYLSVKDHPIIAMEVKQAFHMNGGEGETSYATNSIPQKKAMFKAKHIIEESILNLYRSTKPECLRIADFGCSSGPNTLLLVKQIIDIIHENCHKLKLKAPMFQAFLNDLPSNDFNTIFKSFPSFYDKLTEQKGSDFGPCFLAVVPGSFYGRLFPNNFLHFVYSSFSLHWRSQVPEGLVSENETALNKGNIYISKTSPLNVFKAYFELFEKHLTLFLRSRSYEMIPGGYMVLIMVGNDVKTYNTSTNHSILIFELLGITLNDMVLEGLIEEKKLDEFNLPFYGATEEEVRNVIAVEKSFCIKKFETFKIDWVVGEGNDIDKAKNAARNLRVVTESLLSCHFGEEIMDELFDRFACKIEEHLKVEKCELTTLVVSMTKI